MDDLKDAVSFHGHLCPMFYLGLRMGEYALLNLGRERERGVKLHTVVEFANCFSDGIQFVTGATFGKNNLQLNDKGKFAASFYDLAADRSLRVRVKKEVLEKVLEYGRAGRDVKRLPASNREEEAKRLMRFGTEIVDWLKGLGEKELFQITNADVFEPLEGPSLEYVICGGCGELTLKEYSKKKGKLVLCISCHNY